VLFPHGVLFRNEEADMRRKLVESDLIECVLGLGPGLFYNSPMEACVVICRSQKPKARKGKILFIDAVAAVARERAQSFLRGEHQQQILKAYQDFADVPGFAAVAAMPAVLANDAKLSLPLYVSRQKSATVDGTDSTLAEAWAEFDRGGREFWQQMDTLVDMLDRVVAEEAGDA
jgi:type I restriction enzyme M protein